MATAQKNPIEELLIFGNPLLDPPDSFQGPDDWRDFVVRNAVAIYEGYRRAGWSKQDAVSQTLGETNLGSKAKTEFLALANSGSAKDVAEEHRKKVKQMLAKMPKPIRDAFDRNPSSRFQQLAREIAVKARERGYPVKDPAAIAAAIGRRKYGKKKFQQMAAAGKRRAAHNDGELDEAEKLFQEFHGRDPEEIVELQRSAAIRKTYTACGPLLAIGVYTPGLKLPTPAHWDEYPSIDFSDGVKDNGDLNRKGVMLSANPEGTQLYAIGGDQNLDDVLSEFDVDATKDLVALCEAAYVVYFDEKPHTGFQPVEYMHEFDLPRPVVGYDRLKREIFFVGGRYEVKGNWLEH